MSVAISKGLEGEESIAKNIEWIRQRWKKEIEMSNDPSQSKIAAVEYFHRDVMAISKLKGRLYASCAFPVPGLYGTKIHFSNKGGRIIMRFDKYSCSDPIQQRNFNQLIAQSRFTNQEINQPKTPIKIALKRGIFLLPKAYIKL